MRRSAFVLTATLAAGCGGQATTPTTSAAPATAPSRVAAPAGDPTTLRYGVGTSRYRIEQLSTVHQEVMGQVTDVEATTTMLVSMVVSAAGGDNLAATYTLDSVSVTGTAAAQAGDLSVLRGKVWHSVFSSRGQNTSFTPPDTTPQVAQAGEIFREFLPVLPASIAAGTAWTDTVTTAPRGGPMTVRSRSIRNNQISGWEMRDGVRALKMMTSGTYSLSGEGNQGGQEIQLAGTGVASSERFFTASGAYLAASARDSANILATVVAMGIEVPVRQVRRTTVTRLP